MAKQLAHGAGGWFDAFDTYIILKHFETHKGSIVKDSIESVKALRERIRESLKSSLHQLEADADHRYCSFQEEEMTQSLIRAQKTRLVLLSEEKVEVTYDHRQIRGRLGIKFQGSRVVFRHQSPLHDRSISCLRP